MRKWRIKTDTSNKPVIVFESALDSSKPVTLNLVKKVEGAEITKIIETPAYFDFCIDKNNVYHLAFIKAANTNRTDVNSVFYCSSIDAGKSFSQSLLVHQSGPNAAYDVKMLIDEVNNIHLVYQKSFGKSKPKVIFHAYSQDGMKWVKQSVIEVDTSANISNITFLKGNNGKLILSWQELNINLKIQVSSFFSEWNGKEWSKKTLIMENMLNPAFVTDGNNLQIVFWDKTGLDKRPYPLTYVKMLIH